MKILYRVGGDHQIEGSEKKPPVLKVNPDKDDQSLKPSQMIPDNSVNPANSDQLVPLNQL